MFLEAPAPHLRFVFHIDRLIGTSEPFPMSIIAIDPVRLQAFFQVGITLLRSRMSYISFVDQYTVSISLCNDVQVKSSSC